MNYRQGILNGIFTALMAAGVAVGAWWIVMHPIAKAQVAPPPPAPATIGKIIKEEQINTITLSSEAIQRLALATAPVERKPMKRLRVYGGDIVLPPGQAIVVSSPISGVLKAAEGIALQAGRTVNKGQTVFQLVPILSPEGRVNVASARIDAEGQVRSAQTQLEAAQVALERAQRVLQSEAGSRRAVDEAQAQVDLAKRALEAAVARRDLLQSVASNLGQGTTVTLNIDSPVSGTISNLSALPDQTVPSGAALFEVLSLRTVWVRVPVYVGDLAQVDAGSDVTIHELTARPGTSGQSAKPTTAPPSANSATGTVDLFYQLENESAKYIPGQRIGVSVPLKSDAQSLTVPWAAVLHDIYGGTWVYERTSEKEFVRRRVSVQHVLGDTAVLASGPSVGAKVVTAGAAELFGTETGFSK